MVAEIPTIATVLRDNGCSVTQTRQNVFNALADSEPITMAQLNSKVGEEIDRVSVYRTIDLFEKLGIVNRLQIGWKYKLELSDLFTEHHHHVTCIQCGNVLSIEENDVLEAGIKAVATASGFTIQNHSLEIRGWCRVCTNTAKNKEG
jgi:Fur family transcriptional regulator, ferric uptake regulator